MLSLEASFSHLKGETRMTDYWNATLTVKGVVYEDDDPISTWHVMEPVERRRVWPRFTTEEGTEVDVYLIESDQVENGLIEYRVAFKDENVILPPGTVLYPCRQEWMKKLPEEDITRFVFETRAVSIEFDEYDDIYCDTCDHYRIEMEQCGKVTVWNLPSKFMKGTQKTVFTVPEKRMQTLFKDLLRCVSGVDCYRILPADDRGRQLTFYVSNGESLEYDMVYCHDDVNTSALIDNFLKEYDNKYGVTFQDIPDA